MSVLSIGELLDIGGSASTAGLVPYSALEYNSNNEISGISGSAIAGGIESSVVSSIVSSMVSGKADQSAVDSCCSAMSAEVSAKLDATASSLFQPSGNYMPSGEYYSATNPSGFITTANLTDYAKESALSGKLDASASSNFAPSGNYVFESSYSSFTGNITSNVISISSVVSGKQDALTFGYSGSYISSINGSAIVDTTAGGGVDSATVSAIASSYAESAVSSYVPYSSFEYSAGTTLITAVSGSAIAGQNFNPSQMRLVIDSATMSAGSSESGIEIGVKDGVFQPTGSYATGASVVVVADSAQATASDVVYVVTGV